MSSSAFAKGSKRGVSPGPGTTRGSNQSHATVRRVELHAQKRAGSAKVQTTVKLQKKPIQDIPAGEEVVNGGIMAAGAALLNAVVSGLKPPIAVKAVPAKAAIAALTNAPEAVLVDIRSKFELKESGIPDIRATRKRLYSIPFVTGSRTGRGSVVLEVDTTFLTKLSKYPGLQPDSVLILLDTDGDLALKAAKQIVASKLYSRVYYVKDGAEGVQGWKASGLDWRDPASLTFTFPIKATINKGLAAVISNYNKNPSLINLAFTLAATGGVALFVIKEFETILEVVGVYAAASFLARILLVEEDREKTFKALRKLLLDQLVSGKGSPEFRRLARLIVTSGNPDSAVARLEEQLAQETSRAQATSAALPSADGAVPGLTGRDLEVIRLQQALQYQVDRSLRSLPTLAPPSQPTSLPSVAPAASIADASAQEELGTEANTTETVESSKAMTEVLQDAISQVELIDYVRLKQALEWHVRRAQTLPAATPATGGGAGGGGEAAVSDDPSEAASSSPADERELVRSSAVKGSEASVEEVESGGLEAEFEAQMALLALDTLSEAEMKQVLLSQLQAALQSAPGVEDVVAGRWTEVVRIAQALQLQIPIPEPAVQLPVTQPATQAVAPFQADTNTADSSEAVEGTKADSEGETEADSSTVADAITADSEGEREVLGSASVTESEPHAEVNETVLKKEQAEAVGIEAEVNETFLKVNDTEVAGAVPEVNETVLQKEEAEVADALVVALDTDASESPVAVAPSEAAPNDAAADVAVNIDSTADTKDAVTMVASAVDVIEEAVTVAQESSAVGQASNQEKYVSSEENVTSEDSVTRITTDLKDTTPTGPAIFSLNTATTADTHGVQSETVESESLKSGSAKSDEARTAAAQSDSDSDEVPMDVTLGIEPVEAEPSGVAATLMSEDMLDAVRTQAALQMQLKRSGDMQDVDFFVDKVRTRMEADAPEVTAPKTPDSSAPGIKTPVVTPPQVSSSSAASDSSSTAAGIAVAENEGEREQAAEAVAAEAATSTAGKAVAEREVTAHAIDVESVVSEPASPRALGEVEAEVETETELKAEIKAETEIKAEAEAGEQRVGDEIQGKGETQVAIEVQVEVEEVNATAGSELGTARNPAATLPVITPAAVTKAVMWQLMQSMMPNASNPSPTTATVTAVASGSSSRQPAVDPLDADRTVVALQRQLAQVQKQVQDAQAAAQSVRQPAVDPLDADRTAVALQHQLAQVQQQVTVESNMEAGMDPLERVRALAALEYQLSQVQKQLEAVKVDTATGRSRQPAVDPLDADRTATALQRQLAQVQQQLQEAQATVAQSVRQPAVDPLDADSTAVALQRQLAQVQQLQESQAAAALSARQPAVDPLDTDRTTVALQRQLAQVQQQLQAAAQSARQPAVDPLDKEALAFALERQLAQVQQQLQAAAQSARQPTVDPLDKEALAFALERQLAQVQQRLVQHQQPGLSATPAVNGAAAVELMSEDVMLAALERQLQQTQELQAAVAAAEAVKSQGVDIDGDDVLDEELNARFESLSRQFSEAIQKLTSAVDTVETDEAASPSPAASSVPETGSSNGTSYPADLQHKLAERKSRIAELMADVDAAASLLNDDISAMPPVALSSPHASLIAQASAQLSSKVDAVAALLSEDSKATPGGLELQKSRVASLAAEVDAVAAKILGSDDVIGGAELLTTKTKVDGANSASKSASESAVLDVVQSLQ